MLYHRGMNHETRPIPGYEGTYSVSNFGDVYSHKFGKTRKLNGNVTTDGYVSVGLRNGHSLKYTGIHRIVASAFCDKTSTGAVCVNHKNGVKTFNHATNLEWTTYAANLKHAYDIGLTAGAIGEVNGMARLDSNSVRRIRTRLANGEKQRELAREFSVSPTTISDINRGHTWRHVKEIA